MSDNYLVIDGAAVTQTFKSTENASVHTPHHNIDALPAQHIDAFSRLRVSNPGYRFDSQLTYQIDSDLWDQSDTGDGSIAYDSTNRKATLTAGTGTGTQILQSHYHAPYTPGRGQLVFITFAMPGTVPTNGEVGCGYYDGSNGIYLKRTASGLTLNLDTTTSTGDQSVDQADWNIDPMTDGSGPSGLTLDVTKTNILGIQMQALYVGRVVVGFDVGGNFVPVHAFEHANLASYPYIAQASLPVRYWASTAADAADAVIHAICCTVVSDGGADLQDIPGRQFSILAEDTTLANPVNHCLLMIQCQEQFNSLDQNAVVIPTDLDVAVATAGAWIKVHYNPTYTGTPTMNVVHANSTVKYSLNAVLNNVGQIVDTLYIPASATVRSSANRGLAGKIVLAYSHLLAAGDSLAISVNSTGSPDVWAAIKWKEIR